MSFVLTVASVAAICFAVWLLWANKALELNTHSVVSEKIPKPFDGYRIVHISDLHSEVFGKGNSKLTNTVKEAKPDIIVITGDIVDCRRYLDCKQTNIDRAVDFLKKAVKIAPCYYVTGNHEAYLTEEKRKELERRITETGTEILHDKETVIKRGNDKISLVGMDDWQYTVLMDTEEAVTEQPSGHCDSDTFRILLSHRPEFFDIYKSVGVDLVLAGHAHGGQMRIPFAGGLYAPDQGFFPEYVEGMYCEDGTYMVVSRGAGNSIIPLRVNNRPEVIVAVLKC